MGMDEIVYSLQEAAYILGYDYERIKTMARRSKFPTIDIPYGKERIRKGITAATLELLKQEDALDNYFDLQRIYFDEMKAGVWGKGKGITEKYQEKMKASLERYWTILGVKKSIAGVNAENFKRVMASFAINWEKKQDFYATKMDIYKSVCNIMKVLIRTGHKTKLNLIEIQEYKPSPTFSLKKDFLDLEDIEKALETNHSWLNGRTEYDRKAFDMLISLYAFAGLRKMEAANLRLDQVHLDKGYLHVYGKWARERIVPVFPKLADRLQKWIEYRKKKVDSNLLVPQRDGTMLTETSIETRFQRFRAHASDSPNIDKLTPHALRRSCATIASIYGMPDGLIQRMLGHKHAATTEGYKMVQDRHLVEWAQSFDFGNSRQIDQPEIPTTPQEKAPLAAASGDFW